MDTIIKTAKNIFRPIYRIFMNPSYRYSEKFETMQYIFAYTPFERTMKIVMEFVRYSRLEGDYFEFGVARGGSLTIAYHLARTYLEKPVNFYAFDSFKGLPEIIGVDEQGFKHFAIKGEFSCSLEDVVVYLKKNNVNLSDVTFTQGWYDATLNEETKKRLPCEKAAIIFIDVDLYESSVPVLNFITTYLQTGTVLIFDDWYCYRGSPDRGEQRAVREWLLGNPHIELREFHQYGWNGKVFIVNLK